MILERKDLSLLIALQQDPLAPASTLAKTINLSTPTIISKLENLQQEKAYYNVSADLKSEALELELVDVFFEIDELKDVEYFEKSICYNHPYTRFRIRSFGATNGLFVQFRIPQGTIALLTELFETLQLKNRIQSYFIPTIINTSKTINTRANLKNWNNDKLNWFFDWNDWLSKLQKQPTKMIDKKPVQSFLSKMDEIDMALLEQITMNARRKNTEIMDALNLDKSETGIPQKISRKLKFINKKIIEQYRVFLRWEAFEIYNSFLVLAECDEPIRNKLQNLLENEPIPFESNYKNTEEGFRWYIRCPASHFSNIAEIIWKLSHKTHFYFLDYKKSMNYGLWKGAFDSLNKQWRLDLMEKEKVI